MRTKVYFAFNFLLFTSIQAHRLEFTIEPEDVVVYPGSPAVLNCRAQLIDGDLTQPISTEHISWKSDDGQNLTPILYHGETYRSQLKNGSLYISTVVEHQSLTGKYRCGASIESIGSIVSRSATVRIAKLSGFIQEPKDNVVFPGQTAYFSCLVQADPKAVVRWLKNERPFDLDESRMLILPSGALEIDDVQHSDLGTYRCNASGLNEYRLSNKAVLSFNDDLGLGAIISGPQFIAKPRTMIAKEGETVVLDCMAVGNPKPWITWLKNGVTIDMAHLDSRFQKIGTGSLQISNVEESDAGSYQCRATTSEDTDDATAILEVQVPPKFLKRPQDIREVAKKDIEFECSIYGKPEPEIHWLKNGEIIKHNPYLQMVNGYNLQIQGLISIDAGIFQCIGSNPAGNIQTSAVLTIIDPETTQSSKPKPVTRFPRNKISKNRAHDFLSLLKSSDTIPQPSLKSNSDDEPDDYSDDSTIGSSSFAFSNKDYVVKDKTNLKFDPANILTMLKSDKGDDNDDRLGETHYAFTENPPFPSLLNPVGESSVLTDADRQRGLPSQPRNLTAVIVRQRFVTLSWKAPEVTNGEIISYSVGFQQEGSSRERMQLTQKPRLEEINISGLNPDKKYLFRVTAFNQKGAGKPSEYLEVITKSEEHVPSAPTNLKTFPTSSNSIHVSWETPDVTNGLIQGYKVYFMEDNTERNVITSNLEYELTELATYTEYNIWVVAINQNGPGTATNEVTVRTFSAQPTAPPSNITAEVASSSSVTVRWEPPPPEHQNGVLTGYKIRYRKLGGRTGGASGKFSVTDQNKRFITLNNLERASTYQVKIQAWNINGTGPWSEWVNIDTYENDLDETRVPDEPSPLKSRSMQKSIVVTWNPPKNSNVKVRGYTLGWGKGVPDIYMDSIDGKARFYEIKDLDPDSEYVVSLRAKNEMGDGPPVYTVARTKLESDETFAPTPVDQIPPLIPPVGLKAIVLTASTVVLYWTDTTLSKSQYVTDNRYYVVKYSSVANQKDRFFNATDLNCMIDDLKPNTPYEFTVKVVKGRRESDWSMVVMNTTFEAAPSSPPRDLEVMPFENNPHIVILKWQPPKQSNGVITGYLIQYTTDKNNKERDWIAEGVIGDKHQTVIQNLEASMTYYFKIQARNLKGYGPFSQIVSFTTGKSNGMRPYGNPYSQDGGEQLTNPMLLYLIVGGSILFVTVVAVVLVVICCRRSNDPNMTPDRLKKGYPKVPKNQNIKPPDLWIHHDQMELKALEKSSHSGGTHMSGTASNDGASSSGATTLPRSVGHDYDTHDCHAHATNSLDKRNYVPSYMALSSATPINNQSVQMLPTDSPSAASTIVTPGGLITTGRPAYPRTQYTISRAHVTIDQNAMENPYAIQPSNPQSSGYDTGLGLNSSNPQCNYASLPQQSTPQNQNPTKAQTNAQQGHPLKSFSVPAPPPNSAPGTPAHQMRQHNVAQVSVRPITSSPYKKVPTQAAQTAHLRSNPLASDEARPLYQASLHPHDLPESSNPNEGTRLLPNSTSTEELNQEMANLEGLMKDLNAITASEFEC